MVNEFPIPAKPGLYEVKVAQGSLIMSINRNIGQDPYLLIFGWPDAESHLGQAEVRKVICIKTNEGTPVNWNYRPLGTIRTGILYTDLERDNPSQDLHYFEVVKPPTTKAKNETKEK